MATSRRLHQSTSPPGIKMLFTSGSFCISSFSINWSITLIMKRMCCSWYVGSHHIYHGPCAKQKSRRQHQQKQTGSRYLGTVLYCLYLFHNPAKRKGCVSQILHKKRQRQRLVTSLQWSLQLLCKLYHFLLLYGGREGAVTQGLSHAGAVMLAAMRQNLISQSLYLTFSHILQIMLALYFDFSQ